jgi:hypothetical protein
MLLNNRTADNKLTNVEIKAFQELWDDMECLIYTTPTIQCGRTRLQMIKALHQVVKSAREQRIERIFETANAVGE